METKNKELEGDKIWEEIAKMQISFAGLPQQNVEKYYQKKMSVGESVLITRSSPASVLDQILEDTLNSWTDRNSSVHHEERFVVKRVKEGMLEISRVKKEVDDE